MEQKAVSLENSQIPLYLKEGFLTLQNRLKKLGFHAPEDPIIRFDDRKDLIFEPYTREVKGSNQPAYAYLAIPEYGDRIFIAFWRQVDGKNCHTETEYVRTKKRGRDIIVPNKTRKSFSPGTKQNERGNLVTEKFGKTIIYREPIELPLDFEF